MFHFSTSSFKHCPVGPYESINCGNSGTGRCNNMTARLFLFTFSVSVYCRSRKTFVTIHWTHLPIFNVYKWRHSDVIIIRRTAGTQNWITYKMYTVYFFILWTNRMVLFCNLFIEQPSYMTMASRKEWLLLMRCTLTWLQVSVTIYSSSH